MMRKAMMFVLTGVMAVGVCGAQTPTNKPVVTKLLAPRVYAPRLGFRYEDPRDPAFAEMREEYKLDEVVAGATNDWEIILRLLVWAEQQTTKYNSLPVEKPWTGGFAPDGVTLLKNLQQGFKGACGTYNRVFQAALMCYGIYARDLNIGPPWHATTDVWSDHWGKWIFMDCMTCTYFTWAGIPLSYKEIMKLRLGGAKAKMENPDGGVAIGRAGEMKDNYIDMEFQCVDLLMAADHRSTNWQESQFINGIQTGPPRVYCTPYQIARFMKDEHAIERGINDAYVVEPPHMAFNNIFITRSHYVVTDDELDIYWPLNTVEIRLPLNGRHLKKFPKAPVKLATLTPHLDQILVAVDDGKDWKPVKIGPEKDGLREADFAWTLHLGTNTLRCQVTTVAGRKGRVTLAEVVW